MVGRIHYRTSLKQPTDDVRPPGHHRMKDRRSTDVIGWLALCSSLEEHLGYIESPQCKCEHKWRSRPTILFLQVIRRMRRTDSNILKRAKRYFAAQRRPSQQVFGCSDLQQGSNGVETALPRQNAQS